MSYQAVVDGLSRVLRKIPDFDDENISQADYRLLNAGKSQCIVLFPGQFTNQIATEGSFASTSWVDWEVRIELYVRYTTDNEVATRIAALRELILEKTEQYPFIDQTPGILYATVKKGDQPVPVFKPDGSGPFFWQQVIHYNAREELDVTGFE